MIKIKRRYFLVTLNILFAGVCFVSVRSAEAAGPTVVNSDINAETVWVKENNPYVVLGNVRVNSSLVIKPGVVVKFSNEAVNHSTGKLSVFGSLTAIGTDLDKIIFTSTNDNNYGGDTSIYSAWWSNRYPRSGDWGGISIYNSPGTIHIEKSKVLYAGTAISYNSTNSGPFYKGLTVKNSEISNNTTGIYLRDVEPVLKNISIHNNRTGIEIFGPTNGERLPMIRNSAIYDNLTGVAANCYPYNIRVAHFDARNNWWGDPSGPYSYYYNPSGKGNKVVGNWTMFGQWLNEYPVMNEPDGYSSVAFLPGIQSSRLYKKHLFDEDKLWEPTNRNEDIKDLYLDSEGNSLGSNIYTKDIADSIYGFGIYENFSTYMDSLVSDRTIKEWKALPYDWRLSLNSIVDDGIRLEGGEMSDLLQEIEELAQNSNTGKVTLIGHSNGGLVGKLLIDRLENIGKADLIDKFIMVATPQLGTPKAVAGVLHGDGLNLGGGLIIDKKTARGLAENMSSAYNLLPSEKYFDYVQTPVIEFDGDVKEIYDFRKIYEENIDNYEEFRKFLLGDDGERSDPEFSDTDLPNVLSENLLDQSRNVHSDLDSWQAPGDMEVIQIAGWGLDTIAGIKYDDCDIPFCPDKLSNLDRELVFKQDGDKTVVIPSAISTVGADKYYINLKKYNFTDRENKEHANILEAVPTQKLISNIINGKNNLPEYVLDYVPTPEDEDKRLRYGMHSPVKVDLYDNEGRHTGVTGNTNPDSDLVLYEEEIPNSYYLEFGEIKYLGSDGGFPISVDLTGEDLGTFTFNIDEIYGNGENKETVFADIPVMKGMKASLEIVDDVGIMEIDIEGDGEADFEIKSGNDQGEMMSVEILEKIIENMEIHKTTKDRLINKIDSAKKQIEKGNLNSAISMLESLEHQTEVFSRDETVEKFRIPVDDAEKLIKIIETINNNLIK